MLSKTEYIDAMRRQLDEMSFALDKLENMEHETKSNARFMYMAGMGKLHEQQRLVIDRFDEVKDAGENSWCDLVVGMDKVRDAFMHSYHYFKSQL